MSTHVSLRGIAALTISRSCFNQEEDFPATSKQMTDHRPEGSVSTAPAGNAGDLWARLRCQSVHHPLFWCHSITVSNPKHNDVHGKGNPPPHPIHTNAHTRSTAKETLTCWRAFLLSAICFLYFQRLLRADLCADPVPTLPLLSFSLAMNRFQPLNRDMNHRQLVSAAENIRSHQRIFSWPFPQQGAAPTAQTEMTGKIMRSEALLDETHTQRVSPPHTRIPMVFLHTPPARLHFDILLHPPPTPLLHRHQHAQSSFGTR